MKQVHTVSRLNRRRFLTTTALAAAAFSVWQPFRAFTKGSRPTSRVRERLSLGGAWLVAKEGGQEWLPANVPGCIHTDLLALGKIGDPFYRDNEKEIKWVSETGWIYKRKLKLSEDFLKHEKVMLRCEGLDTLATIKINDQKIGSVDNMFRTWEFNAKAFLKAGNNVIQIEFASPVDFVEELQKKRGQNKGVTGRAWLRKEPCSFGWDWAPNLPSSGIWRDISLEAYDLARLEDVLISQDHSVSGQVGLNVQIQAGPSTEVIAAVTVLLKKKVCAAVRVPLDSGRGLGSLVVENPQLWWPSGMGEQPLYEVRVELLNRDGRLVDQATRRIGLRTLKMVEKDGDKPLHFEVNGVPFFVKGANWIPSDSFATRVTAERLRQYVSDAVAVNMNMLRFWGGGYYEEDALYDACDELGICVWQDFKFACASYPAFDDNFMANVDQEVRDNVRRLRHHPCIAAWCGNNEVTFLVKDSWSVVSMAREGYDKLFKEHLGSLLKELAPNASYASGSPDCGDVHYWDVWWGDKTFDSYRGVNGFVSEFGYQSFPEPKTVKTYTRESDRQSTLSEMMKYHQRCDQGNDRIHNGIGNFFRKPKSFEETLWVSQIAQGYGVKLGVEYWRQNRPESMGCLYWQYNDCWPGASWSSVDYFGRWKALHYMARRFYAPIMVGGVENRDQKTVDLFVVNDRMNSEHGLLQWRVSDVAGKEVKNGSFDIEMPSQASQRVKTLDLNDLCRDRGEKQLLLWLELIVNGKVASENLVTLVRPKELELQDPGLKTEIEPFNNGFKVALSARKPALYVWLSMEELDATYSDNFIHLDGQKTVEILVTPRKRESRGAFAKALSVRSLFDTYSV